MFLDQVACRLEEPLPGIRVPELFDEAVDGRVVEDEGGYPAALVVRGSTDPDPEGDEEDAMGIAPAHLEADLVEAVFRMVPLSPDPLVEDGVLRVLAKEVREAVGRPVAGSAEMLRVVPYLPPAGGEAVPPMSVPASQ